MLIVLVSLVAIGLGSATAWYFFGDIKSSEPITLVAIPADVNADRQIAVATPVSSAELLDGLTKAMKAAPAGITQLYPTTVGNEGLVRPATSAEIFSVLDTTTAPGGFIRTINRASFGAVDGEVPFIILKVQSFDAALSGMIAWEQSMSDDLWPFFGPVVTNSFDPNARTTNQIRPAFFTDTLINNRDVRLLRNELREERILYSFLDRNTILITTTRDAFVKLLPLVK